MRRIVLIGMLAFAVALSATPATAQTNWAHPEGLFRLSLGPEWEQVRGAELQRGAPDSNRIAGFILTSPGVSMVGCLVRQSETTVPFGATQDTANTALARINERAAISGATSETVGGALVVSSTRQAPNGEVSYARDFSIAISGQRILIFKLVCRGTEPLSATDRASMQGVLASLEITLPETP
jgi:hypothetical protein